MSTPTNKTLLTRISHRLGYLIATITLPIALFTLFTPSALATADAYFTLSPASGSYETGATITVSITEYSSAGDNANAVQANLSYSTAYYEYISTSLSGSPFTLCAQNTGGGGSVAIGCAATSTESGTQTVGAVTFKVLAAGSSAITLASGSNIDNTSGTSVFDGVYPSASFTLTAPVTTPPPTPTPTPKKTTTTTTTTTTPPPTPTPTPTPVVSVPPNVPATAGLTCVIENSKGQILVGAKVILDGSQTAYTNSQGQVTFSGVSEGTHTLAVTNTGNKPLSENVSTSTQAKSVTIKLASNSTPTPPKSKSDDYIGAAIGIIIILAVLFYVLKIWLPKNKGKGHHGSGKRDAVDSSELNG